MHIVVAAKVVPDYEVAAADFELVGKRAHSRYTRRIGLYDENAIEMGVQLKEQYGADVTMISYGSADDVSVLRQGLAMGADSLYLVTGASDDAGVIAANLKAAIGKLPPVDLVLAGQQSSDMDRGVVHGMLAEMLGFPFLAQISKIESEGSGFKVTQNTATGSRVLEFGGSGVLSITACPENVPRIASLRGIKAAKKKPVEKLEEISSAPMAVEELTVGIPKSESQCEFLPVEDLAETAKVLLSRLREERYL